MKTLLAGANQAYFSGAIAQLLVAKYFSLTLVCSMVALAHLAAEWLYLGRRAQRSTLILLIVLFSFGLLGGFGLQPKMRELHKIKYASNVTSEQQEKAAKSFRIWHATAQILNILVLGGLTVYVWRANNPPSPTRFFSAMHLKS